MKNIAILHFAYPPNTGGVEVLMQKQAHILAELGYNISIYTGSGQEADPRISITVEKMFQSVMNFNPSLQDKLLKSGVVDNEFYDTAKKIELALEHYLQDTAVVIVHNMLTIVRNLPFIYAFRQFAAHHPEKKLIAWTHDHSYITEFKIKDLAVVPHSPLEKELLITPIQNVMYIAISQAFKKPLCELMKLNNSQVTVIPDGIYTKDFLLINEHFWKLADELGILSAFPLLFAPVNILDRKNLEYSIDVVSNLKKHYPTVKFIISGNVSNHHKTQDYHSKLKHQVERLGLQREVIFLTEKIKSGLDSSELRTLYDLTHAVLYFSLSENFGLPLLETALLKIPLFASDLPVFHEIIGNNIHYIDYRTVSPSDAALKIKEVIDNQKEIKANHLVRTSFDLTALVKDRLVPLIEK